MKYVTWEQGKHIIADYPTKHHSASHHQRVRRIYLCESDRSPKTVQWFINLMIHRHDQGVPQAHK